MKKVSTLLVLGLLNVIHGLSHLLQLVQSLFLASYSFDKPKEPNWITNIIESPCMGFVWLLIGALTMYLGIRDFKHHKKHKD